MDVLLTANQSLGHYYIAARQFWSQVEQVTEFDLVNATMILQYRGNYPIPSSPTFPNTLPLYKDLKAAIKFQSIFRSLASEDYPINVPLNVTTRMFIAVSINKVVFRNITPSTSEEDILASSANNISWSNPISSNVLLAYYRFCTLSLFYFKYTLLCLVKEKGMQFQCLSLAPLRLHVLRCLSNDINKLLCFYSNDQSEIDRYMVLSYVINFNFISLFLFLGTILVNYFPKHYIR